MPGVLPMLCLMSHLMCSPVSYPGVSLPPGRIASGILTRFAPGSCLAWCLAGVQCGLKRVVQYDTWPCRCIVLGIVVPARCIGYSACEVFRVIDCCVGCLINCQLEEWPLPLARLSLPAVALAIVVVVVAGYRSG